MIKVKERKHLWQNVYLEIDDMNFIVIERVLIEKGKHTGSEKWINPHYFTSVRALKFYLINQYSILHIHNIEVDEFFDKLDIIILLIEKNCKREMK